MDGEEEPVYHVNITHNLNNMAAAAGLYYCMWRPDENEYETAESLIHPLNCGLMDLIFRPDFFKQFNPKNGWGSYEGLLKTVKELLEACHQWPDAKVRVSR